MPVDLSIVLEYMQAHLSRRERGAGMSVLWMPPLADTPQRRLRLALVAGALLAQWLVGLAVARGSAELVLSTVAALAGAAVVGWRPQLAGYALIVFTATIFTAQYVPRVELITGWSVQVTELILIGYVGYRALRVLVTRDRAYRLGAVEIVLGLFLAYVLLSLYMAIATGRVEFGNALGYSRRYLLYASFFVFAGTVRTERSFRRFFEVAQALAAVTCVLTIAQALVGRDTRLFFGNPLEYIQGSYVPGLFPRVRPPGFYLTYALFVPAIAAWVAARGGRRSLQGVYLALYSAAVLISEQRMVWLALPLGLGVYLLLSSGRMRARTLRAWARHELAHGDNAKGETMWQAAWEIFARLAMTLEVERMDEEINVRT